MVRLKLNESQAEMDGLKREASDREAELRESLSAAKSKMNDLQMMNKRMKEELAAVREGSYSVLLGPTCARSESESRRQTCDQLGEQIAKLQADSKTSVAEVASLREHVRSIFCSVDYHAHRGRSIVCRAKMYNVEAPELRETTGGRPAMEVGLDVVSVRPRGRVYRQPVGQGPTRQPDSSGSSTGSSTVECRYRKGTQTRKKTA
ncbi:hypothetical protein Pmar_PMAR028504 [Perkinsus marinus ATCC 50983]|uniref:Uncharacterized protein n=1 Tax=Perkinsus marinus (strain ATCC 50983 / TXsc) TaxID=423536 RepID=C5LMB3_PERM5|nr:hypothetical protein Pmar_PMAR028504 [Perkinsus marinus ATCC 50983]EER02125.1 hypothetical protein Pmar_PMAR028504 [Perkinsus marinus ATCC 50983]|eukprot:XP_002769407.1 hypothetical protein Pmar_PMAR028504 [Perkinsus marinus ATCC 50983]